MLDSAKSLGNLNTTTPSLEGATTSAAIEPQLIVGRVSTLIEPLLTRHAQFAGSRGLIHRADRALSHIAQEVEATSPNLKKLQHAIREFTELFQPHKWTRNERLIIKGHLDSGIGVASNCDSNRHDTCHRYHTDAGTQNLIVQGLIDCKRRTSIWLNS